MKTSNPDGWFSSFEVLEFNSMVSCWGHFRATSGFCWISHGLRFWSLTQWLYVGVVLESLEVY